MSKKAFDDFLQKEEGKKKFPINWDEKKKYWLNQLDKLYADVQGWLNEYVKSNKVVVELIPTYIYEEALGEYEAKKMKITVNNKIAMLNPVGTILIGTPGRVDMEGDGGAFRLILAEKEATEPHIEVKIYSSPEEKQEKMPKSQIDWAWKIATDPPQIKYKDLNEDSFLQCLIEVCNG